MARRRLARAAGRGAFVVLAVGLGVWSVLRYRDDLADAAGRLGPPAVAASLLCALLGLLAMLAAWRALLAELGSPLPVAAAARVFLVAQLGKYVPGSLWPLLAQAELGRDHAVPRTRSVLAGTLQLALTVPLALALAAATVPWASPEATRRYWPALLAAPLLLVPLHPRLLNPALRRLLRLARRGSLERKLSGRALATACAWVLLGLLLLGGSAGALVVDLRDATSTDVGTGGALVAATGAFALAWAVGFLVVVAPAGAGVREAALVAGLSSVLDVGDALLVALASRVVLTVADLVAAAAAVLLARRRSAATAQRPASP